MTGAAPHVMFRADASAELGAGHVMRCLALAGALQLRGATAAFASHAMPCPLAQMLGAQGIALHPVAAGLADAYETTRALAQARADALVVDHYRLDVHWERLVRRDAHCMLAIDDLVDRAHEADLLLDQNLGRRAEDHAHRLPAEAVRLIGPGYALLRPEFAAARSASLARRAGGALGHLVVSLGGGDPHGATLQVLRALAAAPWPAGLRITIVMGPLAPTLEAARTLAATLPAPAEVLTAVDDMAGLLASADLAVGAAGGSAWERCCLGVPTLLLVLADNQRAGAQALAKAGAALLLDGLDELPAILPAALRSLADRPERLHAMSQAAAAVTDGLGAERVADALLSRLAATAARH